MQKINSTELLNQLQADTRQLIADGTVIKMEDPGYLLDQPAPGKWSVIQILEHLNSYGRYYLLAIERSLQQDKPAVEFFKSGWLGNYFTKLMKPSENGTIGTKMQAPRNHRPSPALDAFPVINTFIDQQHYLLELLEQAKSKNIGSIRTPVSISKFIRLKVGDTFRFFVAHEQRHFVQLYNTLKQVKEGRGQYKPIMPGTPKIIAV
ncbi:MAG TPA: DinB family protein [Chitinophagaceae bacterium]